MRTKLVVLMAGISFFCLAVSAAAHHGFDTEYDANKKVKLTGVVTKVEWLNPHMRVYIDVTDAKGDVTNWNLELTSPNTVRDRKSTRLNSSHSDRSRMPSSA